MKRLVGENLHPPVRGVLQLVFEVGKIEEAPSSLELDQDVDVALLVHLAPDDGAEEGRSLDPILSQDLDYCITHGLHLTGHKMPDVVDVFMSFCSVGALAIGREASIVTVFQGVGRRIMRMLV